MIGIFEEGRQGDGVLVALAMQSDLDRLQEGFARFRIDSGFQVLAGPQHDMPDEGIGLLEEAWEETPDPRAVRRA